MKGKAISEAEDGRAVDIHRSLTRSCSQEALDTPKNGRSLTDAFFFFLKKENSLKYDTAASGSMSDVPQAQTRDGRSPVRRVSAGASATKALEKIWRVWRGAL